MALDIRKLKKVKKGHGGTIIAQCPACHAQGGDQSGEHLIVYPNGAYGCCIHPKDREHNREIFAQIGGTPRKNFGTGKDRKFKIYAVR